MKMMLINKMMTKQDMIESYVHLHPIIYGVDVEFWWVKSNDRNVGASCQRIMIWTNLSSVDNDYLIMSTLQVVSTLHFPRNTGQMDKENVTYQIDFMVLTGALPEDNGI